MSSQSDSQDPEGAPPLSAPALKPNEPDLSTEPVLELPESAPSAGDESSFSSVLPPKVAVSPPSISAAPPSGLSETNIVNSDLIEGVKIVAEERRDSFDEIPVASNADDDDENISLEWQTSAVSDHVRVVRESDATCEEGDDDDEQFSSELDFRSESAASEKSAVRDWSVSEVEEEIFDAAPLGGVPVLPAALAAAAAAAAAAALAVSRGKVEGEEEGCPGSDVRPDPPERDPPRIPVVQEEEQEGEVTVLFHRKKETRTTRPRSVKGQHSQQFNESSKILDSPDVAQFLRKPTDWKSATDAIRRSSRQSVEFVEIEGIESGWMSDEEEGEEEWSSSWGSRRASVKELRVEAIREVLSVSRKDTPNQAYWTRQRISLSVVQTVVLYLIQIVLGLNKATLGPLIPLFADHFGVAENIMTWVVVFQSVGAIVGGFVGGVLLEAFKVKENEARRYKCGPSHWINVNSFTVVFAVALGVLTCVCSFVNNFALYLGIELLRGMFMTMAEVATTTAIGWVWRERVYPFMQGLHCAQAVGCVLGPLVVVVVHAVFGSNGGGIVYETEIFWSCLICGVVMIPILLPLCVLPVPREAILVAQPDGGIHTASKWKRGNASCCKKCLCSVFSLATFVYIGTGLIMGLQETEFDSYADLIIMYGSETELTSSNTTLAYLGATVWGGLLLSRFISAILVTWIPDLYVVGVSLVGNTIVLAIASTMSKNLIAVWICSVLHAFLVGPLTAALFSLPQSVFKLPISTLSVAVMTVFGSFGVIVNILESLLWDQVKSILFIIRLSVFVVSIPLLLVLLSVRLFKPASFRIEKWSWVVSSGSSKRETLKNARFLAKRVYYEESKRGKDNPLIVPLLRKEEPRNSRRQDFSEELFRQSSTSEEEQHDETFLESGNSDDIGSLDLGEDEDGGGGGGMVNVIVAE